jgi:rhodanese-related sulfurtransferase
MSFFSKLFGSSSTSNRGQVLTTAQFKEAISKGKVQLIDVRTAKEFNSGHIKGAKNIDFFNSNTFTAAFEKLNKDQPVYLYCRSGNRSSNAVKKIAQLGFKEIYDLQGGYMRWK